MNGRSMTLEECKKRIIDEGIGAARIDYKDGPKLQGSIAGFEACRATKLDELLDLLKAAEAASRDARHRVAPDYWWFRCYELEVEWVCNCLSAVLQNEELVPLITPTVRGYMKVANIVGVQKVDD